MERDLWKVIMAAIKALPPRSLRNSVYTNKQILAVIFWAALHDRPISWASKRINWPVQAWRRRLPDQSTMSRRMRDPDLIEDINRIIEHIQIPLPERRLLLTDGKAYAVTDRTNDPEAINGWASGCFAKGYKLHVIIDEGHRLLRWRIESINHGETTASSAILSDLKPFDRKRILVGDAGYDSNPLHAAARSGLRLIAPRHKPGTGLGNRRHHPNRLSSIGLTEGRGGWMWEMLRSRRNGVDRYFSGLVTSCVGAGHLPSWVRSVRRTRLWIGAKLAINAARIVRNQQLHA
ncbi:MAG: transposase [Phycisphaerales bacterium]|nr:transposase [Phycisphaerales bacterium]